MYSLKGPRLIASEALQMTLHELDYYNYFFFTYLYTYVLIYC